MRRGKVCEAEYVRQFVLSIKQLMSPSSDSSDRSASSELSNNSPRWRELVARASTVQ